MEQTQKRHRKNGEHMKMGLFAGRGAKLCDCICQNHRENTSEQQGTSGFIILNRFKSDVVRDSFPAFLLGFRHPRAHSLQGALHVSVLVLVSLQTFPFGGHLLRPPAAAACGGFLLRPLAAAADLRACCRSTRISAAGMLAA